MIDPKKEIMNVAIDLFAKSGYHSTTIRDIAAKSNINSSMIGYYYQSKENLYVEIFRHLHKEIKSLCCIDVYDSNDENALNDFINKNIEFCLTNKSLIMLFLSEQMISSNETISKLIQSIKKTNYACFKEIYRWHTKEVSKDELQWKYATLFSHVKELIINTSKNKKDQNFKSIVKAINNIEVSLFRLFNINKSIILQSTTNHIILTY